MLAHTMKLIPLWSSTGAEDSLYDEVVLKLSDNRPVSINESLVADKSTDDWVQKIIGGFWLLRTCWSQTRGSYGLW